MTLNNLLTLRLATRTNRGLTIPINESLIIAGEDRLSYTTIFRLVECCRELHWKQDVLPLANVDSISKTVIGYFKRPIFLSTRIEISYQIRHVSDHKYTLIFDIIDDYSRHHLATVEIENVFFDPKNHMATAASSKVVEGLRRLESKYQ